SISTTRNTKVIEALAAGADWDWDIRVSLHRGPGEWEPNIAEFSLSVPAVSLT
ncbi:MAG: hypothetical protein ACI9TB_002782, partial [Parasphingorhabdus sp.]